MRRGLTAALLGEPAKDIEARRPYLTQASRLALKPVLGLPMISTRVKEVTSGPHLSLVPAVVLLDTS